MVALSRNWKVALHNARHSSNTRQRAITQLKPVNIHGPQCAEGRIVTSSAMGTAVERRQYGHCTRRRVRPSETCNGRRQVGQEKAITECSTRSNVATSSHR